MKREAKGKDYLVHMGSILVTYMWHSWKNVYQINFNTVREANTSPREHYDDSPGTYENAGIGQDGGRKDVKLHRKKR